MKAEWYVCLECFPRLEDVRPLQIRDSRKLLGPGCRLSSRWHILANTNYSNFDPLPGHGVLFWLVHSGTPNVYVYVPGMPRPNAPSAHATVLWRGLDGNYVYFDLRGNDYFMDVARAIAKRDSEVKISVQKRLLQGVSARTCMYHAMSFMDYVLDHLNVPTVDLLDLYSAYLGPQGDERAVMTVERIIREDGLSIDINRNPDSPLNIYGMPRCPRDVHLNNLRQKLGGLRTQIEYILQENTISFVQ